jgi:putative nucleotidyltransferase with HDIG domain
MTADEILDQIKVLPPNTQVAIKLMKLLRTENQHNEEIVETIQYEPSLTARLLKVCNSAYWGRKARIGTVDEAILQLGYQEVLTIVTAMGIGEALTTENQGYGMGARELWLHTVVTAMASQKLAEHSKLPETEAKFAFTAGLLHDLGKTAVGDFLKKELEAVRELVQKDGYAMVEAETMILGTNHAEIGGRLLERWKLPSDLVDAVSFHHKPQLDRATLSALVHLANCSAHLMGSSYGWDSMAVRVEPKAFLLLGIQPEDVERTMLYVHEDSERINAFIALV